MEKILDGVLVSEQIKQELKENVKNYMIKPCLVVIQVGYDELGDIYIKNVEKACNDVGIYFKHIKYDNQVKEIEIINKIIELNNDEYVHGIMVQNLMNQKYNKDRIVSYISRKKDVDGLTDTSLGKLFHSKKGFVPSTALGIINLLDYYNIDLVEKNVVIVGNDNLVSKPLIGLLLDRSANVIVCQVSDLENYTKNADILISATRIANLITKDMVKEGCIVIDAGITVDDGKIFGSVDFEEIKNISSFITPVLGGVGQMSIASLLNNVNEAYKNLNTSV